MTGAVRKFSFSQLGRLFRLRSSGLLCGLVAACLSGVSGQLSIGVLIGFGLFVLNSLFLYEGGCSLLRETTRRRARLIASFSGLGRLLFLGVALALIGGIGTRAQLGACGGLLLGQANLHLATLLKRGVGRCSST